MRDKQAAMQARRDLWFFRYPDRAIRHVMHVMQSVHQRKSNSRRNRA
jgi:hypothetical protein